MKGHDDKRSIDQEEITVINIYAPNVRGPKSKQKMDKIGRNRKFNNNSCRF